MVGKKLSIEMMVPRIRPDDLKANDTEAEIVTGIVICARS